MSLYGSFNRTDSLEATGRDSESSFSNVCSGHAVVTTDSQSRPGGTKLVFENVFVDIENCSILKNVSGMAVSGEILAILGPSGAGKSTLLNALTGRRKIASGRIRLNDDEVDRNLRRKISYVLQNDVFYPWLTLKETLTFTAKLKLPDSTTVEQREKRIQAVVDLLELNKCINTKMGGIFEAGLSGGERKRASIACELIHNPNILVLDEPTSGLDSAIASSLMRTLTDYAEKSHKTVITTIHQPSSQIFRMFNNVIFLTEGQVAYYGPSDKVIEYFSRLDFRCDPLYNPADFALELMKSDTKTVQRIIEYAEAQMYCTRDLRVEACRKAGKIRHDFSKPNFLDKRLKPASEVNEEQNWWFDSHLPSQDAEKALLFAGDVESHHENESKWATSFSSQYATLIQRFFVLSRSRFLSFATFWQILVVSVFVGLQWFQFPRAEEVARDKLGMIFLLLTQQCFFFMQTSLPLIYGEQGVFIKERASGAYRLSALVLATMTTEVPITIVIATVCMTVPYWMVGLMPTAFNYFAYLGVHLLNAFLAQSIGYFLGILVRDRTMAATFGHTVLLISFLSGGYFNTHLNEWFAWIRYISFTTYIFSLYCEVEFVHASPLRCNDPSKTSFPEYCTNGTMIPGEAFVRKLNINVCSFYVSIIVIVSAIISLRLLTYTILRFFRRPEH